MLVERLPQWLKDDPHFMIYHDELDMTELALYYDLLRSYVMQPIQAWTEVEYHDIGQPTYTYNVIVRGDVQYPLKRVRVYDRNDELLTEKLYSKYDITHHDDITIEAEPPIMQMSAQDHVFDIDTDMSGVIHTYDETYDTDMTFYVVVEYHGFTTSIKVGFPQSEDPPEPHFAINNKLDEIAESMGMMRRRYKEDNEDLENAYPVGYPYPIEQDYWFEKRLLSEYVVEDDPVYSYDVYSDSDEKLMTLECADMYPKRVSLVTCSNDAMGTEMLSENQSGVEIDLTGLDAWSPDDVITITRDNTVYYSGEYSLKASFSDYDDQGSFGPSGVACLPDRYYRGTAMVKGTGYNVAVRLSFWDGSNQYISEVQSETITPRGEWYAEDGEWFELQAEGLAPYDAAYVKVDVVCTPEPGVNYWYDSGSIVEIPRQTLSVTAYETNGAVITEDYEAFTLEDIVSDVNANSKILSAELFEEGVMEDTFGELRVDGLLKRFGILKSEVFAHCGVIPDIIDLWTYLLKWNLDGWYEGKMWGGGEYMPGVFYVDIPYHGIPSNFIHLTNSELQSVVDRCKMFGTRAHPRYTVLNELEFSAEIQNTPIHIGIEQELEFEAYVIAASDLIELYQATSVSYSIDETCTINLEQGTSVSYQIASILTALNLDSDAELQTTARSYDSITSGTIRIGTTALSKATLCQQSWNVTSEYPHQYHFSWTTVLGVDNAGVATAKNTLAQWGFPNWLATDVHNHVYMKEIPDDAIITGFVWTGAIEHPYGGGGVNNYVKLYVGGGKGLSSTSVWSAPSGYQQWSRGSSTDLWGFTAGSIRGSDVKSNLQAWVTVGGVAPGSTAKCDYSNIQIHYKYGGARFVTQIIPATAVTAPAVGKWGTLIATLSESLPSQCTINYDIIREFSIGGEITPNGSWEMGTTGVPYIAQAIWNGSYTAITGFKLRLESKVGNPTDSIQVSIALDQGGAPGAVLQTYWIPTADLPTSFPAVIDVPIAAYNLAPNQQYWIFIARTGSLNSSNYYRFSVDTASYGGARYWNTSIWRNNNAGDTLYHQVMCPQNLAQNVQSGYNMENISYENIKIIGKLTTTNNAYTPKVDEITVTRKEVVQ